ncbi:aminotransferase class I/II-fold pyridoxal phosphate-dependent enzyme [Desulfofundulus salinus]|uniref:Decarboxylase n=1 Tax=Desulfofundulus salinus TaxID=2419843 RepID=A0A494WWP4_9FIRM|nr:decarboxylase [Desulfofundulus salinum]RKO67966.1 decarboxylase [Desulfofundulus salinum]
MNQQEAPLVAALYAHCARSYAHLHVPAHRQGEAIFPEWQGGKEILQLDLTELPGLDDLHRPEGVIARAQALAAELFGAGQTFFLVNGSTVGITALFLALCRPGDEILLPRNAHRAVLGGLIFSGAKPVFLEPVVIEEFGIAAGLTPQVVAGALEKHPQAKGLLVLHPTYYGVTGDLPRLVGLAHGVNKPVLADEAHGVHFAFHAVLPPPALQCGVDAAVQSMHKMGGSLTQSSLLHLKGNRVDVLKTARALRLLQSSSPSYLLLASLDGARRQLATKGREMLERAVGLAREVRQALSRLPGITLLGEEHLGRPGANGLDPTRLVISLRCVGLTGYQAARILARDYRVQVEMADYYNLVVVIGIGTTRQDCELLIRGLQGVVRRVGAGQSLVACPERPPLPVGRLTPRQAWLAPSRPLPLEECAGHICAEWVNVSPPGIPLLYPGEEIGPEMVEYLQWVRNLSLPVQGPEDPGLASLRVVVR